MTSEQIYLNAKTGKIQTQQLKIDELFFYHKLLLLLLFSVHIYIYIHACNVLLVCIPSDLLNSVYVVSEQNIYDVQCFKKKKCFFLIVKLVISVNFEPLILKFTTRPNRYSQRLLSFDSKNYLLQAIIYIFLLLSYNFKFVIIIILYILYALYFYIHFLDI